MGVGLVLAPIFFRKVVMKKLILTVITLFAINAWGNETNKETYILATIENVAPFVMATSNATMGLDMDLMSAIAKENDWNIEVTNCATITDVLKAVKDCKADFGMSGITINSARSLDGITFSHPYFLDGGISVMTHIDNASLSMAEKAAIAWPTIKRMMLILLIIVAILGHAIWFRESRNGDDANFHSNYFKGIFESYYWAIVTSSTVGFGDITAKTVIGRLLTVFAIIIGLTWFADFQSDMAAVKSVILEQKASIGLSDLNGKKVATIINTTSHDLLSKRPGIEVVSYSDLDKVCKAVANKEVFAIVYDAPVLRYYADSCDEVCVSEDFIVKEEYGIAMRDNDPKTKAVNCAILTFKEDGRYTAIENNWFDKE